MREGCIWDIFSAQQELNTFTRDKYDRFPFNKSNFDLKEPLVSKFLYQSGFKPKYPGGKSMAVCISHDVDLLINNKWPLKTMVNQQAKAFLKADLSKIRLINKFSKRHINSKYSLRHMIDFLDEKNIKSTFYFLSLHSDEGDFNYQLNEISEEISYTISNGFEIGLHGGLEAYNNFEKLLLEKENLEKAIGQKVKGYRNHYLKFIYPDTLCNLQKANFLYDTTFGFAESIGFRNGMCYPFAPYDSKSKSYLNIYELPLMVMDDTLFNYMKLTPNSSFDHVVTLTEKVKSVNGVLTLLWHNNEFFTEKGQAFKKIIDFLETQNVWFTTSKNLIEWFSQQGYFEEIKKHLEKIRV